MHDGVPAGFDDVFGALPADGGSALGSTAPDYSSVREPEPSDIAAWTQLADVATWAKLKGDLDWAPSPLGSLLRLFADDEDISELLISEGAGIKPQGFEVHL